MKFINTFLTIAGISLWTYADSYNMMVLEQNHYQVFSVGDQFAIELDSNPSDGYKWTIYNQPSNAKLAGYVFETNNTNTMYGVSGKEVFTFNVTGSGIGIITLAYKRNHKFPVNVKAYPFAGYKDHRQFSSVDVDGLEPEMIDIVGDEIAVDSLTQDRLTDVQEATDAENVIEMNTEEEDAENDEEDEDDEEDDSLTQDRWTDVQEATDAENVIEMNTEEDNENNESDEEDDSLTQDRWTDVQGASDAENVIGMNTEEDNEDNENDEEDDSLTQDRLTDVQGASDAENVIGMNTEEDNENDEEDDSLTQDRLTDVQEASDAENVIEMNTEDDAENVIEMNTEDDAENVIEMNSEEEDEDDNDENDNKQEFMSADASVTTLAILGNESQD